MDKTLYMVGCIGMLAVALIVDAIIAYGVVKIWDNVLVPSTEFQPLEYRWAFLIVIIVSLLFGGGSRGSKS